MDHYAILGLPRPGIYNALERPTEADIKQAYRAALLKYHPDKANASPPPATNGQSDHGGMTNSRPSVDAIRRAYDVLLDHKARAEYDRELLLRPKSTFKDAIGDAENDQGFQTGGEAVDLDDMQYNDDKGFWYRPCRCGEAVSYVITEQMLEAEEKKGLREVVVGCVGCSLRLKVAFGVGEEHGNGEG